MNENILKRKELIDKIINAEAFDNVKLIRGVRGCGKTVLLKQLSEELINRGVCKDNIMTISLFAFDYRNMDPIKIYDSIKNKINKIEGKVYLFLDDVEGLSKWQSLVNWIRNDFDCEIYATINYSKFHALDDNYSLLGKSRIFEIYPFSFKEFKQFHDEFGDEQKSTKELFKDYVRIGGMPDEIQNSFHGDNLKQLFEMIIGQDFVKDNDLDYFSTKSFLEYMIWRFCEKFSKKSFDKYEYVELDDETLSRSLSILKDSSFMLSSPIQYDSHRFKLDEKYYLIDHGFHRLVFHNHSSLFDEILRNIIFVELKRRGYRVSFIDKCGEYVDFIAYDYTKHIAIQFSYIFLNKSIALKEINDLNSIKFNCEKYIITTGDYDFSKYGVKHLNIIDFLLGSEI